MDRVSIANVIFERFDLGNDDIMFLAEGAEETSSVGSHTDVLQSNSTDHLHVLQEGWACRYKLLTDGRRQITSFHLPGEILDLDRITRPEVNFAVLSLSECRVVRIPINWVRKAIDERPAIRNLLWALTNHENALLLEHIVSLGQRSARERLAYLLGDLLTRLQALGEARNGSFTSYMTQAELADALGLSTVHLNRTLQSLKADRLIEVRGRTYTILDPEGLQALAKA